MKPNENSDVIVNDLKAVMVENRYEQSNPYERKGGGGRRSGLIQRNDNRLQRISAVWK